MIGSLAILAWVDWTLLLGAIVLLPTVFLTHRAWINNIRPQFRVIRKQREQIDAGATESFAGMRIVRAFSRQKREAARFTTENNLMARQELVRLVVDAGGRNGVGNSDSRSPAPDCCSTAAGRCSMAT